MKTLTKRQKQAIATKLKIAEVSIELFSKYGVDKVKIQDICDKVDISIGAFYHHFASKAEIINVAYAQVDVLVQEKCEKRNLKPGITRIVGLFDAGADVVIELGYSFVSETYKNIFAVENKYTLSDGRFIRVTLSESIEEAINLGEIDKNCDKKKLEEAIFRMGRGAIFDWCIHNGNSDIKSIMASDIRRILESEK